MTSSGGRFQSPLPPSLDQRQTDGFNCAIKILDRIVVPDTQKSITLGQQPCRSRYIPVFVMLATIEFDDQSPLHAQKIDNEWTDRCLTTEFETVQLAIAKSGPEFLFDIRRVSAQSRRVWADLTSDGRHPSIVQKERPSPNPLP